MIEVIILTYNDEECIGACLDAVMGQTMDGIQVTVGDNNSVDNTLQVVGGYAERYPDTVSVVPFAENHGFCRGNNLLFARVESRYVAFLNSDAVPAPDWLETTVEALINDPQAAVATPTIVDIGEESITVDRMRPVYLCPHTGYLMYGDPVSRETITNFAPFTAAVADTASLQSLEYLFDERLFMYCDDMDLSMRLLAGGLKCLFVPSTFVSHPLESRGRRTAYLTMRNAHWVLWKHFGVRYVSYLPWLAYHNIRLVLDYGKVGTCSRREGKASVTGLAAEMVKAWKDAVAGLNGFTKGSMPPSRLNERICRPRQEAMGRALTAFDENVLLHG